MSRLRLHKKALALRDAKTACKLAPLQPTAHYRAAKAHASLGRWEDSVASIEVAAQQLQPPPGCFLDDEEEQDDDHKGVSEQIEVRDMATDEVDRSLELAIAMVKHNEPREPTTTTPTEDKSAESAAAAEPSRKLALRDVIGDDDDEDDFFGSGSDSDSESQTTQQTHARDPAVDDTETETEEQHEGGDDDSKNDDDDTDDDDSSSATTDSTGTESSRSTATESTRSTGSISSRSTGAAASSASMDSTNAGTRSTSTTTRSVGSCGYKETRIRLAWGRGTGAESDDSLAARIIALAELVRPRLAALRRKGEEGDPLNPNYKPPRGLGPGMVPPPPPPALLVEVLGWKETSGGKVVYTVQAECESGLVVKAEHRYSSLDLLNKKLEDVLMTANTDSPLPPFPGKSFFGSGGSDVAEGRRFQLDQWLHAVISIADDCDGDLVDLVMDDLFGANYDSLSKHIPVLKDEGYDDVSLLRDATTGDLEELGIHRVHAEEIVRCAQQSQFAITRSPVQEHSSERVNVRSCLWFCFIVITETFCRAFMRFWVVAVVVVLKLSYQLMHFILIDATCCGNYRRVKDALTAEIPGGPPLRVSLKTLLNDEDAGGVHDGSSDDDDNSTMTSTSRSTRTESTGLSADGNSDGNEGYARSRRSSTSSSSSDGGFGAGGGGDDEWKPGALLAGLGSAPCCTFALPPLRF